MDGVLWTCGVDLSLTKPPPQDWVLHATSLHARACPLAWACLNHVLTTSNHPRPSLLSHASIPGPAHIHPQVAALLAELGRMGDEEPDSKALVFSSWGRLLRLVHEALVANGGAERGSGAEPATGCG